MDKKPHDNNNQKTATTNAILKCIKYINPDARILLLAPTGKAAKRMTESCGEPAMTIHRGLGINPAFSKKATEEDLLNYIQKITKQKKQILWQKISKKVIMKMKILKILMENIILMVKK